MKRRILKQAGITVLAVAALFIAENSHAPVLERGSDAVLSYMEVNYTAEDIKGAAAKGKATAASISASVNDAAGVIAGTPSLGEPIDEEYSGNSTAVYAVSGGNVTAVGENEEIGKYIRITHGAVGESLYGNLKSVNVAVPSKVKKGQIIGVYEKEKDKEFYYSFTEFK